MEIKKYIGKVLPDGRLSLPKDIAKNSGKIYEVILLTPSETDIYSYTEELANEKGFSRYSEKDIEEIIHESRGIN